MGREVRKVPADWQHPKDQATGRYTPLFDGYTRRAGHFMEMANDKGLQEAVEWFGCVDKNNYMPDWPENDRTHFMMYEDSDKGIPVSPAFATPEELARWLTDPHTPIFANETAGYEAWLRVCLGGYASGILDGAP